MQLCSFLLKHGFNVFLTFKFVAMTDANIIKISTRRFRIAILRYSFFFIFKRYRYHALAGKLERETRPMYLIEYEPINIHIVHNGMLPVLKFMVLP
jgi:hypothetical protein